MDRIPEPELMEENEQAKAYSDADFEAPHEAFVAFSDRAFSDGVSGRILDLGCGPGDITCRFATRHPSCTVVGVDGSEAMLHYGQKRIEEKGLQERITLKRVFLPSENLGSSFDGAISNSLLHHLEQPEVLWDSLKAHVCEGGSVFVMDLMRPDSEEAARNLVEVYSADEPEVLRRDFFLSLLAAYRPDEIQQQLDEANLGHLTLEVVSDRHWVVYGKL